MTPRSTLFFIVGLAILRPTALPGSEAVFDTLSLDTGKSSTNRFRADPPPPGLDAVLSLKARIDRPRAAGYTRALKLALNGTTLDGKRLVNKPAHGASPSGRIHILVAGERFSTFYSPDFSAPDQSPSYGIPGVKSCEFELRVTDLLRAGENELVIRNAADTRIESRLVAAEGRILFKTLPASLAAPQTGPPTGPLPLCRPAAETRVEYEAAEQPGCGIEVRFSGGTFRVQSEFSTPGGQWVRAANPFFRHTRSIDRRSEAIIVRDTFTNLTGENLPLMQRHRARAAEPAARIWISGISPAGLDGAAAEPSNPTAFVTTEKSGLGLLPLDDAFQVHVSQRAEKGAIEIADKCRVLKPGATCTSEWAVLPVARPDYFDMVNAARRLLDANFTLRDCFAFLRAHPITAKWTDAQLADFVRLKSASLVCASIMHPLYQGLYPHGTAFQRVAHDSFKDHAARLRRLAPEARSCVYFHCFIDATEDSRERFAADRVLKKDGAQADYNNPRYPIFFPTENNAFGREVRRNVDIILDEIGANGVYWDEFEYSAEPYHYGEPWDGCSADIDPRTCRIARLKSSVTLLSQPWRLALAREILARGPLIANGQPHTRAIAALKIPRFVETGSPSNCTRAQLHSPIALGDHNTEASEQDAYRGMLSALDYGCLYHWYNDLKVIPQFPTLTQYMYPITPVELHEGYIIGKERILTNRSGLFGWGDRSEREVHVYNNEGREVPGFNAPTVTRDGATCTELRIAEGWSAAIVRK